MARSLLHTFSDSKHFEDRNGVPYAHPITERINPHSRPIVSYYFPKSVGEHHYGDGHPMKPHRLTLTNALVIGYGLDKQIHNFYNPTPATREELLQYHDEDYIDFLSRVSPGNQNQLQHLIETFNCMDDCPIFADMYDFTKMYAGASLAGARKLCAGTTDIAINWSGGLHHAKRGEASGFCYINDIVLAILELLRFYPRVLYIDIDIHHGDGVEQAFWNSNRVMTVSFHKYVDKFFPGTGKLDDNGGGLGKHFALNVPLLDGIDDDSYVSVFKTVIGDTVTAFRPSAIVLQCGADSLSCDRLGAFNLSIAAHGSCVDFVRRFNVPMLVVGGGGYTVHNVSRCWTYETSVLVGAQVPNELPQTAYDAWFAPDYTLHPALSTGKDNMNTPEALQRITRSIRQKLKYLQGAPSVQMQEIPPNLAGWLAEEERNAEETAEDRGAVAAGEFRVPPPRAVNEYYDHSDTDVDEPPTATRARGTTTTRRARGRGSRARGRGRGRGRGTVVAETLTTTSTAPNADGTADEDETMEDADHPPVSTEQTPVTETVIATPRARGRGRGRARARGRGRGRGRASVVAHTETESVLDPEPETETHGSDSAVEDAEL